MNCCLHYLITRMHVNLRRIILFLSVVLICGQLLFDEYPQSIPAVNIRVDSYSKKMVTSGHLHNMPNKMKLKAFKKLLQCSPSEPDFEFNSGARSLFQAIPPSKEILELMCAYGENQCTPWKKCQKNRLAYRAKNQTMTDSPFQSFSAFQRFKLIRVVKGTLYYDWPWGIDRFNYTEINKFREVNEVLPLMKLVLERISDMPDSVFFAGCENPALPKNFPFPIFSSASSAEYVDIPWPWMEAIKSARSAYYAEMTSPDKFAQDPAKALQEFRAVWSNKIPKAAFFVSYDDSRMLILDAGRRNPDLFDVSFGSYECIEPWHPASNETCIDNAMRKNLTKEAVLAASTSPLSGYALPLVNISDHRTYHPRNYKYVIVPMGGGGTTTSGRLAGLLAYSGAVILLQRTLLVYHFSARLKPWVHYVPLSYSGADVAEKVRWLRDHDDLARQIAENGRSFARSYLRLEDYYCYGAAALEMVGELERGSDVLEPFTPRLVNPLVHNILHVNASGRDWIAPKS